MARRYWTCRKCKYRQERRTNSRKCLNCGELTRREGGGPAHAQTLRNDSYEVFRAVNANIHAVAFDGDWTPDDCGVCGKKPVTARMDREHGHDRSEPTYGKPRGLACGGDWGCNALMARLTLAKAEAIVAYLSRANGFYGAPVASEEAV